MKEISKGWMFNE